MLKAFVVALLVSFQLLTYAQYKEVAVANGGKLTGKVTFKGESKVAEGFKIVKDTDCCGAEKPNHRLSVSDQNMVKNALIIIEGIKEGKAWAKAERKIDQTACVYSPFVQVMEVGKKIKIVNSDPILHNVHGYLNGKTVFNLAMPLPGQEIKAKLEEVGMHDISCDAGHAWMSAYVYVSEHPYAVVTGEDGSFELSEVPPGEYTVKMWHAGWRIKEAVKDENGIVTSYKYEDPVLKEAKVKIEAGQAATLDFTLE